MSKTPTTADFSREEVAEFFVYLDDLRESGDTNMFGASPYLQHAFGLNRDEARAVLSLWMKLHSDPARTLKKPVTKQKAHKLVSRFELERGGTK